MRRIKVGDQIRHRVFDETRIVSHFKHEDGETSCFARIYNDSIGGVKISAAEIEQWWEIVGEESDRNDRVPMPGVGSIWMHTTGHTAEQVAVGIKRRMSGDNSDLFVCAVDEDGESFRFETTNHSWRLVG